MKANEMSKPGLFLFGADWRGDPALFLCSEGARYLWFEMLLIANDADGYILIGGKQPTPNQLAIVTRTDPEKVVERLDELEENGVFSRTSNGTIYSRRIVKDLQKVAQAREYGKRGGNPTIVRGTVPKEDRPKRFRRADNPTIVKAIWDASGGRCTYCDGALTTHNPALGTAFEIDHKIPIKNGGDNSINNLTAACKRCNFRRNANGLDETARSGDGDNPTALASGKPGGSRTRDRDLTYPNLTKESEPVLPPSELVSCAPESAREAEPAPVPVVEPCAEGGGKIAADILSAMAARVAVLGVTERALEREAAVWAKALGTNETERIMLQSMQARNPMSYCRRAIGNRGVDLEVAREEGRARTQKPDPALEAYYNAMVELGNSDECDEQQRAPVGLLN